MRQAQARRRSHPQGRSLSELWQWGLQVGLGEAEGAVQTQTWEVVGVGTVPAPRPQVDAWWVGLGVSLARTQAKGWKEATKAGTDLVSSAKNDAQLGSCEFSFIWGKMRTAAREAAPQTAVRDCSKEATCACCVCACVRVSRSVMSDSLQPHGL